MAKENFYHFESTKLPTQGIENQTNENLIATWTENPRTSIGVTGIPRGKTTGYYTMLHKILTKLDSHNQEEGSPLFTVTPPDFDDINLTEEEILEKLKERLIPQLEFQRTVWQYFPEIPFIVPPGITQDNLGKVFEFLAVARTIPNFIFLLKSNKRFLKFFGLTDDHAPSLLRNQSSVVVNIESNSIEENLSSVGNLLAQESILGAQENTFMEENFLELRSRKGALHLIAGSDKGWGQGKVNEDRASVKQFDDRFRLTVVDGMGGHGNGDYAASVTAKHLAQTKNKEEALNNATAEFRENLPHSNGNAVFATVEIYLRKTADGNYQYVFQSTHIGDARAVIIGKDGKIKYSTIDLSGRTQALSDKYDLGINLLYQHPDEALSSEYFNPKNERFLNNNIDITRRGQSRNTVYGGAIRHPRTASMIPPVESPFITLEVGDTVLLLSDGFTDNFANSELAKYAKQYPNPADLYQYLIHRVDKRMIAAADPELFPPEQRVQIEKTREEDIEAEYISEYPKIDNLSLVVTKVIFEPSSEDGIGSLKIPSLEHPTISHKLATTPKRLPLVSLAGNYEMHDPDHITSILDQIQIQANPELVIKHVRSEVNPSFKEKTETTELSPQGSLQESLGQLSQLEPRNLNEAKKSKITTLLKGAKKRLKTLKENIPSFSSKRFLYYLTAIGIVAGATSLKGDSTTSAATISRQDTNKQKSSDNSKIISKTPEKNPVTISQENPHEDTLQSSTDEDLPGHSTVIIDPIIKKELRQFIKDSDNQ